MSRLSKADARAVDEIMRCIELMSDRSGGAWQADGAVSGEVGEEVEAPHRKGDRVIVLKSSSRRNKKLETRA